MSAELMLFPLLKLRPAPFLRTRVAVMPCLRSSAFAIAGLELAISPFARRPCLSVPSQTKSALAAIYHLEDLVARGHAVDFRETRDALHDLDQPVAAQVRIAMCARLLADFDAVRVRHNNLRYLGRNFNYFI